MDKIGIFRGVEISKMNKEQLLDFASWAGKRIEHLERLESETPHFRIKKEIEDNLRLSSKLIYKQNG